MGYYDFPHTRNYDTDLGYIIDKTKENTTNIATLDEEIKRIDIRQLNSICKAFNCEISELLEYIPDKK